MNARPLIAFTAMFGAFVAGQQSRYPDAYSMNLERCTAMAKGVDDLPDLSKLSTQRLNELDFYLGMCGAKHMPIPPKGVVLILYEHGHVSDELQNRYERAIKTLPPAERENVYAAYNALGTQH